MKRWIIAFCILGLAGPALGDETREGIEATNARLSAAIRAGDSAAAAECYTEDAQLLAPNTPPVTGRAAITAYWQGGMAAVIKGLELETLEVLGMGDVVTEVGSYTVRGDDDQEMDRGKYVVVWKKVGEEWKLHRDMFNSSVAPVAHSH